MPIYEYKDRIIEKTVEVPKVEVRDRIVEKIVERPRVEYQDRIVTQIEYVDKIIETPQVFR